MNYIEINCHLSPSYPAADILMSMLTDLGYESFVENENGFLAYIPESFFDPEKLNNINIPGFHDIDLRITHKLIPDENWNEVWERNYQPVTIGRYFIRAPFHQSIQDDKLDIIIAPKMSFGTGHHETTFLMIYLLDELEIQGKSLLDVGCGTGILAIVAALKKASRIVAVDIDHWAYENTRENLHLNDVKGVEVIHGDVRKIPQQRFDVILANIHLNVLINDLHLYKNMLNPSGNLLLSGLYESDFPKLKEVVVTNGLSVSKLKTKNKWIAVTLIN